MKYVVPEKLSSLGSDQKMFGFFYSDLEKVSKILSEETFLELLAVFEIFDERITENWSQKIFLSLLELVVGRYGNMSATNTYVKEIELVRERVKSESIKFFSLVPMKGKNEVPFPSEIGSPEIQ